mmetsp:Transcript_10795/g.66673  ORF Transcript_10795/g.66673 Transcript_10795/m.66673 type:complete len:97 (+) Transcript_10795:1468-1758(+)
MGYFVLYICTDEGASLSYERQGVHSAPSSSRPVLLLVNKGCCCPFSILTGGLKVEIGAHRVSGVVAGAGSRSAGLVLVTVAGEGPSWVRLTQTVIH